MFQTKRTFAAAISFFVVMLLAGCSFIDNHKRTNTMDNFQIKDGDRVVFLGDSLTASRAYGEIIERYTHLSYPTRRVQFFNAGIGGDTAQGGLKRLEETVLIHKPTIVTVCYGINDIGWGTKADPESVQDYYDGMAEIARRCQKAGARVFVLGPCATRLDPTATGATPDESDLLARMSRTVRANAEKMGTSTIDLYGEFRKIEWAIRLSGRETDFPTHAPDGIHLSDLGNLIFAYIVLKGLGAPDSVSDLTIDASTMSVMEARRCQARDLARSGETLSFTRLDNGWPLHLGTYAWINFPFVPSHEKLSAYYLKITGLPEQDWYEIRINGRPLCTVNRQDLERGLNLAYSASDPFANFPPWKEQSATMDALTKARTELTRANELGTGIACDDESFNSKWDRDTLAAIETIENLQHKVGQSRPLRFEVAPGKAPTK